MFVKRDAVTGMILIVLAGVVVLGVRGLPITQKGAKFGPGSFPLVVGIGLALLAALLLLNSFHRGTRAGTVVSMEPLWQTRPLAILLVTTGYFALISLLGFLVSTVIFVIFAVRIFGERSYKRSILYAVAFTFPIYFLFTKCLKMVLPVWGMWGF